MTANNQHVRDLIVKFLQQSITEAEQVELDLWIGSSDENRLLFEQLNNADAVGKELQVFYQYDRERGWEKLQREWSMVNGEKEDSSGKWLVDSGPSTPLRIDRTKLWKRIAVAASIVGVLFVTYFLLNRTSTTLSQGNDPSTIAQDVPAPDKNRAQIKLADGTVVYLDSVANGQLALQGNVKLVKNANGEIVYEATGPDASTPALGGTGSLSTQYNTMFNPRGSKVQMLLLDDGTRVWLNAESSITYPTAFVGNERRVEISGEAYFEVAKDASKKFYVTGAGVTTEVLGTHFNVNTFKDDGVVRVTLIEGKVKTSMVNPSTGAQDQSSMLKPGEQASAISNGTSTTLSIVKNVDVEQVMAWKNGRFKFGNTSIEVIMQQIARWYDVEIEYRGKISETFGGGIDRKVNVSEVLKKLELTGEVHFVIEGKKIIVMR